MFNLQGGEIIIVLLLALVVLGPEKLPDAMRKAGRAYAELRKVATGFQDEFRKAVHEPVEEVRGSVRETANLLRDSADFTKLAAGERDEKPHTAPMAPAEPAPDALPIQPSAQPSAQPAAQPPPIPLVAPPDPAAVPTDATPTFADQPSSGDATAQPAQPAPDDAAS